MKERHPPAGIKEREAWREGFEACRRGGPLTACRYVSTSDEAHAWLHGYLDAKASTRRPNTISRSHR